MASTPAGLTTSYRHSPLARYIEYKRALGQPVNDVLSRGTAHILPSLGVAKTRFESPGLARCLQGPWQKLPTPQRRRADLRSLVQSASGVRGLRRETAANDGA
jgi:hypothetical protein